MVTGHFQFAFCLCVKTSLHETVQCENVFHLHVQNANQSCFPVLHEDSFGIRDSRQFNRKWTFLLALEEINNLFVARLG